MEWKAFYMPILKILGYFCMFFWIPFTLLSPEIGFITAPTTRRQKAAKAKPPEVSIDAIDVIKLAIGICGGVLVKDYAVYQKINQRVNDCFAVSLFCRNPNL